MSRKMRATAIAVVLAAAICAISAAALAVEGGDVPVLPREEVLKSLPCFGCHTLEGYLSPPEGAFSHELHGMMNLHCGNCHEIKGHEMPRLKGASCASCHSTGVIDYAGGGMGKVRFNHDAHGAMFPCGKCHPALFSMKKGAARLTMNPMYEGKLCGACHDGRAAFSSQDCMKCHRMG